MPLPMAKDLSTQEGAQELFQRALAERDPEALSLVLLLDPGKLDQIAEDDGFWQMLATPEAIEQALQWSQSPAGSWILEPKPR